MAEQLIETIFDIHCGKRTRSKDVSHQPLGVNSQLVLMGSRIIAP